MERSKQRVHHLRVDVVLEWAARTGLDVERLREHIKRGNREWHGAVANRNPAPPPRPKDLDLAKAIIGAECSEEELKKESERFMNFLDGEGEIFDFDLNCSVLFMSEKEQVDMGLRVRVHRTGYMNFKTRVLDLEATRGPLEEQEPTTPAKPDDGGTAEDPGEEDG